MDAKTACFLLIKYYQVNTGHSEFSYNDLRMFYYKNKLWRIVGRYYDWHTIERTIRKLCSEGYLDKVNSRRFLITNEINKGLANHLLAYLGNWRINNGYIEFDDIRIKREDYGRLADYLFRRWVSIPIQV